MEYINSIQAFLNAIGVDWWIVLLYICAGFVVKAYLPETIKIPFINIIITDAWKVLIVGTMIVTIYTLIQYQYPDEFMRELKMKLFVSYIFTTSFYEIALKNTVAKYIVKVQKRITPKDE